MSLAACAAKKVLCELLAKATHEAVGSQIVAEEPDIYLQIKRLEFIVEKQKEIVLELPFITLDGDVRGNIELGAVADEH